MTRRSLLPIPLLALTLGLPLILALRADLWLAPAKASPPLPTPIDFLRNDGALNSIKPSSPMSAAPPRVAPDCVAAAYAKLGEETKVLAAIHGADTPAFAVAHASRKEALVSQAALDAAGCKIP